MGISSFRHSVRRVVRLCCVKNAAVVGVAVAAAELSPARESLPERGRGLIQGRDFEEGGWAGVGVLQ